MQLLSLELQIYLCWEESVIRLNPIMQAEHNHCPNVFWPFSYRALAINPGKTCLRVIFINFQFPISNFQCFDIKDMSDVHDTGYFSVYTTFWFQLVVTARTLIRLFRYLWLSTCRCTFKIQLHHKCLVLPSL